MNACQIPMTVALHYLSQPVRFSYSVGRNGKLWRMNDDR